MTPPVGESTREANQMPHSFQQPEMLQHRFYNLMPYLIWLASKINLINTIAGVINTFLYDKAVEMPQIGKSVAPFCTSKECCRLAIR